LQKALPSDALIFSAPTNGLARKEIDDTEITSRVKKDYLEMKWSYGKQRNGKKNLGEHSKRMEGIKNGKTLRLTMAQALVKIYKFSLPWIDGVEVPLFGGVWRFSGHGNVAGK